MTGLRKRVSIGFLSIAVLLSISGLIAFFELNTLSQDTESILNLNRRKMDLGREMLLAAQSQDEAFIHMAIFNDRSYDTICLNSINRFEQSVKTAYNESSNRVVLDSISMKLVELKLLAYTLINEPQFDTITPIDRGVVYEEYRPVHSNIIESIYNFTTASQLAVEPRAQQLQRNAYRAVTPVLISLVVMIIIVLLLYYFMIIYCVNPIVRMNRSLGDFLTYRMPFTIKDDCNDEVKELQEKIESVTTQLKRRTNIE